MVLALTRKGRRRRLRARPFPRAWRAIIERNVPIFRRLPPEDRRELLGHVHVFLAEKHFEGAGGLEMNDEIRLTIAAQACLLLLHRETDYYPQLRTILVYPSGYTAYEERHVAPGIWEEGPQDRFGHTADRLRAMVLAWDQVRRGAAHPADGDNLVYHEFAHQLDFEERHAPGTPALASRSEYLAWTRVMSQEYESLRAAEEAGIPTLLNTYGALNRAEFFAVITEVFFERPRALHERHPALYSALTTFYRQDPESYSAEPYPAA